MTESSSETPRYKRVILKLSGESFSRGGERGISMEEVVHLPVRCIWLKSLAARSPS